MFPRIPSKNSNLLELSLGFGAAVHSAAAYVLYKVVSIAKQTNKWILVPQRVHNLRKTQKRHKRQQLEKPPCWTEEGRSLFPCQIQILERTLLFKVPLCPVSRGLKAVHNLRCASQIPLHITEAARTQLSYPLQYQLID